MVFLTLVQFYSCTKAATQNPAGSISKPNSGDNSKNEKGVVFTYLDSVRNPTEQSMFIHFQTTDDNVIINRSVAKDFKIYIR